MNFIFQCCSIYLILIFLLLLDQHCICPLLWLIFSYPLLGGHVWFFVYPLFVTETIIPMWYLLRYSDLALLSGILVEITGSVGRKLGSPNRFHAVFFYQIQSYIVSKGRIPKHLYSESFVYINAARKSHNFSGTAFDIHGWSSIRFWHCRCANVKNK